jgi:hypothetical protein
VENLPELIERHRPDYVCILIGVNDTWNRGSPAPTADPDPWAWRCRTGRLLALARQAWIDRTRAAQETPRGTAAGTITPGTRAGPGDGRFARLLELDRDRKDSGDPEEFFGEVERFRAEVRSVDDVRASEEFVEALTDARLPRVAVQEGAWAIQRFGQTAGLCRAAVGPWVRIGDSGQALDWARVAVQLGSRDAANHRALAAALWAEQDHRGAVRAILCANALDPGGPSLEIELRRRNVSTFVEPSEFELLLDEAEVANELRPRARQAYEAAASDSAVDAATRGATLRGRARDDPREKFTSFPSLSPLAAATCWCGRSWMVSEPGSGCSRTLRPPGASIPARMGRRSRSSTTRSSPAKTATIGSASSG